MKNTREEKENQRKSLYNRKGYYINVSRETYFSKLRRMFHVKHL